MKIVSLLLAALLPASGLANAQDWPARPVKFILSQSPGTSPDITARLLADRLSRLWPQPVVVAVNPTVPAKSLAELVALDKAQPGKLAAANEGTKTFSGLMSQMLNKTAGIELLQVPYAGVSPAIQDTIAGRTQVVLVSSAAMLPFLKRGDLRPLAVTAGRRVRGLETVPTLAETYPGFEYVGWFALLAPTGTPAAILQRVNRDMDRVLADPEIAQKLYDLGLVNEGAGTPESLNDFLRAERERWAKLVKDIGLQPE